ncbi:hypothetical protein [Mycolicibacterium vaccae]|uniref:hypothetical protein n=1 Tax=Mycolicibacterium vaccae TaxID=1810 RepID=UPI00202ABA91|nr:hypothetical protein [Mycolicibacterium vaccae]
MVATPWVLLTDVVSTTALPEGINGRNFCTVKVRSFGVEREELVELGLGGGLDGRGHRAARIEHQQVDAAEHVAHDAHEGVDA